MAEEKPGDDCTTVGEAMSLASRSVLMRRTLAVAHIQGW